MGIIKEIKDLVLILAELIQAWWVLPGKLKIKDSWGGALVLLNGKNWLKSGGEISEKTTGALTSTCRGKPPNSMAHSKKATTTHPFYWEGFLAPLEYLWKHNISNITNLLLDEDSFLKRNSLLQKTAITKLSCEYSRRNILLCLTLLPNNSLFWYLT